MADILYIVVPCYNEEDVLPETSRRLKEKLTNLIEHGLASEQSRILFRFQIRRQLQILLVSNCRRCCFVRIRE